MKNKHIRSLIRIIVCSGLTLALFASTAFGATMKKSATIYSSPNQKGKSVAKLAEGDTVTLVAKNGSDYKVKTSSGKIGYVPQSAVSNGKSTNTSNNTSPDPNNTYARSSSGNKTADEVLKLLNAERKKENLPVFLFDTRLQTAAKTRANELTEAFNADHSRPDGSSVFTVFEEVGLKNVYQSENIASGQATAQDVVNSWMNSSLHKANIMNKNHQYIGVSYAKNDEGKLVWSLLFWGPVSNKS